ncbi:MAG: outer membrane beta-barrel protein [Spirosomataceae bacterium]
MKKLQLLIMGLITLSLSSFAQNKGKISGSLFDEKRQAMPFANVLLLKAKDSTLAKGAVADAGGQFAFEQVANNQYIVSISMVGYKKYYSPKITISAENLDVKLQDIQLEQETQALKEVTVVAKKPLLEQQADKLVMNVENSIVNSGSTAMEVLQRAPGVSIDQNDNISLKGKQGVQIYLDGKPTYMSQEQLANLLKNMNSDQIEKIEIISNPSARYDAAGNSGIINIITKRNKNFGTNGSLSIGAGVSFPPQLTFGDVEGNLPKGSVNLNLNNRQGKFNTFGNISSRYNQNFQNQNISRVLDGRTIDQYGFRPMQSHNTTLRAGADYFASKKTTIGVLLNANLGEWMNNGVIRNNAYIRNNGVIESSPQTTSNPYRGWKNLTFNTNFKHAFNDKGKELTADFDYSVYDNQSNEKEMITRFFNGNNEEIGTPLRVTSDIPNVYNIYAIKTDFVNPLPKSNAKLEFGAKSSFVKSDNNIQFFNDGKLDIGRTNHFIYTENVNAAYANFNKKINDKWNIQTGLRAEQTISKGESKTLNESRRREYINLFPSVYLTHTVNKNNQLNLNYSRRIDRPDYQSLNPFIFFLDPYTYELGNEYLRPQLTHSLEVTHTFKQAFVTTVGYSYTDDFMTQIVKNAINEPAILERLKKYNYSSEIDPNKISFAIRENIGTRQNLNLGLSFPVPVTKWWNMNNNISMFYNKYEGMLLGTNLNVGNFAYNLFTSQNFTLKKGWTAEASMWYNSKNIEGMMNAREMYAINGGVSKSFWNRKGSLRLTVNDIFATARFRGYTNFAGVKLNIDNRWDSRQVRMIFTYRFGNQNVKASRNRQTATSAEQRRVGSEN